MCHSFFFDVRLRNHSCQKNTHYTPLREEINNQRKKWNVIGVCHDGFLESRNTLLIVVFVAEQLWTQMIKLELLVTQKKRKLPIVVNCQKLPLVTIIPCQQVYVVPYLVLHTCTTCHSCVVTRQDGSGTILQITASRVLARYLHQ